MKMKIEYNMEHQEAVLSALQDSLILAIRMNAAYRPTNPSKYVKITQY